MRPERHDVCLQPAGLSTPAKCAVTRWCALIALSVAGLIGSVSGQAPAKPELYFVAIGNVPNDLMDDLVADCRDKFRISIRVLLPIAFDRETFDSQRSQVVAERVIQAVRFRHPTLAERPETRVIGITSQDMYMAAMQEEWSFAFSSRSPDSHFAVVSYARLDPVNSGEAPDNTLLRTRLRKMVIKNIGIMYYALPPSDNPKSVLFRNILSLHDVDKMTEDFDPKA